MDRRNFLRTMIGGVAAGAAVRTWPFRVYSFPATPVEVESEFPTREMLRYGIAYWQRPDRIDFINLERWGRIPFSTRPIRIPIVLTKTVQDEILVP